MLNQNVVALLVFFHAVHCDFLNIAGLSDLAYESKADVNIGGIFPLHQAGQEGEYCGPLRELGVLQRAEAMAFYINEVNKNPNILPNVTLGFIILDDCYKETVALAQGLKFVQNTKTFNGSEDANLKDVVAVVGAESSTNSRLLAELLGLFEIPQISYLSTNADLIQFPYFTRIAPSDEIQIKAMTEVLNHFNWQYVSFVYSMNWYGLDAYLLLTDSLKVSGSKICLAVEIGLPENPAPRDYKKIVDALLRGSDGHSSHVVILFMPQVQAMGVLKTAQKRGLAGKFTWIASDAWGRNPQDFRGVEEITSGALTMKISSTNDPLFDQHFAKLSPANSSNPFLPEFWSIACNQSEYKCQRARGFGDLDSYKPETTISLVKLAVTFLAHRIDELQRECRYDVSNPADCYGPEFRKYITGKELNRKLRGFQGCIGQTCAKIENDGDGGTEYSVMNLRKSKNGDLNLVRVGFFEWLKNSETNQINGRLFMLPSSKEMYWNQHISASLLKSHAPESLCSRPCSAGQRQVRSMSLRNAKCCWDCQDCSANEVSTIIEVDGLDTYQCKVCPVFADGFNLPVYSQAIHKNSTCEPIVPEYLKVGDPAGITIVIVDVLCILITTVLVVLYFRNREHRLVKATSLELSAIIWTGLLFSYISVIFYFMPLQYGCDSPGHCYPKAQNYWCYIQFVLFSISPTIINAPIVTRANRIYRIFRVGKKSAAKPRFIESKYQVTIVGIIILVQVVIIAICALISGFSNAEKIEVDTYYDGIQSPSQSYIYCDIPYTYLLPPVIFNILLCMACAYQAFKTRKLPDNFNESKFIGMTIYTTVVAWIAVVSAYLTIPDQNYKILPLCIALMVNATITNSFLFIPRLYALFWVEKGRLNLRTMSVSTTSFSGDGRNLSLERTKSVSTDSIDAAQTVATVEPVSVSKTEDSIADSSDSRTVILSSYSDSGYETTP